MKRISGLVFLLYDKRYLIKSKAKKKNKKNLVSLLNFPIALTQVSFESSINIFPIMVLVCFSHWHLDFMNLNPVKD